MGSDALRAAADVLVVPVGGAEAESTAAVARALQAAVAAGDIDGFRSHELGVNVQGTILGIAAAVERVHRELHALGVGRVSTDLRIGTRAPSAQPPLPLPVPAPADDRRGSVLSVASDAGEPLLIPVPERVSKGDDRRDSSSSGDGSSSEGSKRPAEPGPAEHAHDAKPASPKDDDKDASKGGEASASGAADAPPRCGRRRRTGQRQGPAVGRGPRIRAAPYAELRQRDRRRNLAAPRRRARRLRIAAIGAQGCVRAHPAQLFRPVPLRRRALPPRAPRLPRAEPRIPRQISPRPTLPLHLPARTRAAPRRRGRRPPLAPQIPDRAPRAPARRRRRLLAPRPAALRRQPGLLRLGGPLAAPPLGHLPRRLPGLYPRRPPPPADPHLPRGRLRPHGPPQVPPPQRHPRRQPPAAPPPLEHGRLRGRRPLPRAATLPLPRPPRRHRLRRAAAAPHPRAGAAAPGAGGAPRRRAGCVARRGGRDLPAPPGGTERAHQRGLCQAPPTARVQAGPVRRVREEVRPGQHPLRHHPVRQPRLCLRRDGRPRGAGADVGGRGDGVGGEADRGGGEEGEGGGVFARGGRGGRRRGVTGGGAGIGVRGKVLGNVVV